MAITPPNHFICILGGSVRYFPCNDVMSSIIHPFCDETEEKLLKDIYFEKFRTLVSEVSYFLKNFKKILQKYDCQIIGELQGIIDRSRLVFSTDFSICDVVSIFRLLDFIFERELHKFAKLLCRIF